MFYKFVLTKNNIMKTIEIKNTSGKVLYTHTCENNTIKITLEKAVSENANLENAYLKNAYLKNAYLINANLENAYLINADLINAYLINADLINAYLINADLKNADLINADLYNADLRNANLENADLINANLKNAYLINANLISAENYYSFVAYDTSKRLVHCVKHEETWMVKAGCLWGTLKELEEKVLQSHKSKVYLHNIELLKTL